MAAKNEQEKVTLLERGDVYFFYRPRVRPADQDVLSPSDKQLYRLITIGRSFSL